MLASAETIKASGKEQTYYALVFFHGVALVLILKIFTEFCFEWYRVSQY